MSPPEKPDLGSPDASRHRFEAELAALSPRMRLDRDRLMYLAGQASAAPAAVQLPRSWGWQAALGGMTAVAASLLVVLAMQPSPQVIEKVVQVPIPVPLDAGPEKPLANRLAKGASSTAPPPAVNLPSHEGREEFARYFDLRDRVLVMGLESWANEAPAPDAGGSSPAEYHQMLNRLLHEG